MSEKEKNLEKMPGKVPGKVHFMEEAKVRNAVKESSAEEQKDMAGQKGFSNSATNPIKDNLKGSLLKYVAFKDKFAPKDI